MPHPPRLTGIQGNKVLTLHRIVLFLRGNWTNQLHEFPREVSSDQPHRWRYTKSYS